MKTTNRQKYPCIVAWGKYMLSLMAMTNDYYTDAQCDKAAEMNAPRNAIYERDGVWNTADQIEDMLLRDTIESWL